MQILISNACKKDQLTVNQKKEFVEVDTLTLMTDTRLILYQVEILFQGAI